MKGPMRITVLFFATLRDVVGARSLALELTESAATIAELRRELSVRYPAAADNLAVALAAIDEEFAFDHDSFADGAEVAFFPPVSGGSVDLRPEIFLLPRRSYRS